MLTFRANGKGRYTDRRPSMFVRPQAKETGWKVAFFCLQVASQIVGFLSEASSYVSRGTLCSRVTSEVTLGLVHPTTLPVFTGLMMLTDCFRRHQCFDIPATSCCFLHPFFPLAVTEVCSAPLTHLQIHVVISHTLTGFS